MHLAAYTARFEFLIAAKIHKRRTEMLITKKMLLALTIMGALLGAGIGALVTHSSENTKAASSSYETPQSTNATDANYKPVDTNYTASANNTTDNSARFKTAEEQAAYRQGLADCEAAYTNNDRAASNQRIGYANTRSGRRYSSSSRSRRVYYDYSTQPRGRTFWQKHRDKLTVAMGTGAGAILGGVIGGKKGAGIGALAGAGGSALYTYKLRNRTRRY
jgi:hypothetical protein